MVDGPNSSSNHPATATSGGTRAKPTPANNAGGGSGWGYPGFAKGGTTETADTGLGHVAVGTRRAHVIGTCGFANDAEPTTTSGGVPTCVTEDHSFMERKPGGPDTLPGWKAAKNILSSRVFRFLFSPSEDYKSSVER
ncbi:Pc19g00130 [Penicillium rubens Wisconsin 54-1255]|uniref:Pc19g00130 protein n=1 Tax=Penicillium rubens (strain ATCC 28089 / DSM 1075 / NRRL 1951 / Wisconsin 54-1255) TaxID=500485 RepID=B6HD08_PENRW|nr:Pc19g00130 [Penicillium rubens Wisconsin 54-1255]